MAETDPSLSLEALTELAYRELRSIAHRHLAKHAGAENADPTLNTTALVHEAYLKLAGGASASWRDEAHFRAIASVAMRHILVDRARARAAERHGGGLQRVTLDEQTVASDEEPETLLAIDAACTRLAEASPRLARLVELRFFGGLSESEVAAELGLTLRTVQRDWTKARALLAAALAEDDGLEEPAAARFASLLDERSDQMRFQAAIAERYEIVSEIGSGGMAMVYRARDRRDNRLVALKVLRASRSAGVSGRFRREMSLASRLHHPRILPLLESGESDGRLWYTMPLVDGDSLGARLRKEGRFSVRESIALLRDIAEALHYAHALGVVHRDLKPDNVLLSDHGPVVADFGVAKAIVSAALGDSGDGVRTATGASVGTPAYMSPEQVAGEKSVDHRTDLYAFGVIAYELLTGAPPFEASSRQMLMTAQLSERPRPLSSHRRDVPPALESLITRLLEKRAQDRPASASEVAIVLDNIRGLRS